MKKKRYVYYEVEGGVFRFTPRQWKAVLEATIANNDTVTMEDYGGKLVCLLNAMGYLDAERARDLLEEAYDTTEVPASLDKPKQ